MSARIVRVRMRAESGRQGRIVPPLLTLDYGLAPAGRSVSVRLRVTYSMDMDDAREQIEVGATVNVMTRCSVAGTTVMLGRRRTVQDD